MDVYYINLDRRVDRRLQMEQRFSELNLLANRISAVQPSDLTSEQKLMCQRSLATSDPVVEVELCCNLSHKRAFEAFLATGATHAAFFEDDVVIADDLPNLLSRIDSDGLPCDILRIETYLDRCHYGVRPIAQFGRYVAHDMYGYTWGSAGYLINRKVAEAYLAKPKLLSVTMDRALWRRFPDVAGLKNLQLIPAPVAQIDRLVGNLGAGSDIASERQQAHQNHMKHEALPATLRRFLRDEITIALPSLISRWLGRSRRGSVPFSDERVAVDTNKL